LASRGLLSGEEIEPIEGRDDLTTDNQLLQVIAFAQIFVSEDSSPEILKILNDGAGCVRWREGSGIEHACFLSNARASIAPAGPVAAIEI